MPKSEIKSRSTESARISRFLEKLKKENLYSLEVMDEHGCEKDDLEFEKGRGKAIEISRKITKETIGTQNKRRMSYFVRKDLFEKIKLRAEKSRKGGKGSPYDEGLVCGFEIVGHFIRNMKFGEGEPAH